MFCGDDALLVYGEESFWGVGDDEVSGLVELQVEGAPFGIGESFCLVEVWLPSHDASVCAARIEASRIVEGDVLGRCDLAFASFLDVGEGGVGCEIASKTLVLWGCLCGRVEGFCGG